MPWEASALALADRLVRPRSPWHQPLATTPRHLLVPRWWTPDGDGGWRLATADEESLEEVYSDRTLVTRVGPLHADEAADGDVPAGLPTSSSTLPGLLLSMYGYADLLEGDHILDAGTGVAYGTALLARRFGDGCVTSVDVDPHLTKTAAGRLADMGLHPEIACVDATRELPGTYDRIIATFSVRPVPASWLRALRPGGRLVAVIAGTTLVLVADKQADGSATGHIEWGRAGFMGTRHGADYPAAIELDDPWRDGEEVTTGRYPVVDVVEAWDLSSMLDITAPGIRHWFTETDQGERIAWMVHEDGSWSRATSPHPGGRPEVHQGGPRRLWGLLDQAREYWLQHGELPVRGAGAMVKPDGRIILRRGGWKAVIE
ncbi:methyltransferase domain-containing protein [Nonomuraea sp. NPDC055795]